MADDGPHRIRPGGMHTHTDEVEAVAREWTAWALRRVGADDQPGGLPIGRPRDLAWLDEHAGRTVTEEGLGPDEVLRIFTEVLEPSCLSVDHHGYLSFVPQAPSEIAVLGDMLTAACSIYAGSWMEGGGAVWAENQALDWLRRLASLPPQAGGVFLQGGTNGNLSALVAAREHARHVSGRSHPESGRWIVVCGQYSHASVTDMAKVADCEVVTVPGERLTGDGVRAALSGHPGAVAAVVATAGSTNLGRVDRLDQIAGVCEAADVWFHVDGAYGAAALASSTRRHLFTGIERADSLVIDPHKWLFSPFDCCALLYRDPAKGRAAHTQKGSYLEILNEAGEAGEWNPSDFGVQLSRRARGLPLWFALATHGTDAFERAIDHGIALATATAELVDAHDDLELLEKPELSIVAFRRRGWTEDDYDAWSTRLLEDEIAFVVPSKHDGEPILRLCFLNPRTTIDHVQEILDTL